MDSTEAKVICHTITINFPWIEDKYSSYTQPVRIAAWILCFHKNVKAHKTGTSRNNTSSLSVIELRKAEIFLCTSSQNRSFKEERQRLLSGVAIQFTSPLLGLNPMLGSEDLLRGGGRLNNSSLSYAQQHPIIRHGKDILTVLMVRSKHISLLHACSTLLLSVLSNSFHIVRAKSSEISLSKLCNLQKGNN